MEWWDYSKLYFYDYEYNHELTINFFINAGLFIQNPSSDLITILGDFGEQIAVDDIKELERPFHLQLWLDNATDVVLVVSDIGPGAICEQYIYEGLYTDERIKFYNIIQRRLSLILENGDMIGVIHDYKYRFRELIDRCGTSAGMRS
jgi:hypothetical protein